MANLLDMVGGVIIAGFVLLGLLAVMLFVQESEVNNTMDNMVQMTTTNIGSILENDFRKIGFMVPVGGSKIVAADSTSITFRGDVDSTGSIDSVRYYLGSASSLSMTPNPYDRPLYRVFNGVTQKGSNFGLTDFTFTYYDSTGAVTTTVSRIKTILVKMTIQSIAANNGRYAGTYWQARFRPMNLSVIY